MTENNFHRQARKALSHIPYFAGLDEATWAYIAERALRRTIQGGEAVFWEGDACTGIYVVEAGWLKAIKLSPGGREQVLHFLGPGEVFNGLCVFTSTSNPATVIALEPSVVWNVERDSVLRVLEENPACARLVIEDLAGRLLHMVALVEDISLRTVEARLAHFLLEQSAGEKVERQRWATQAEMAARLGTVPDVLSRALRKLSEQGLIEVARHQIKILDPAGLEKTAENPQ
jgi:CRP/FNR family transcriptional regulator